MCLECKFTVHMYMYKLRILTFTVVCNLSFHIKFTDCKRVQCTDSEYLMVSPDGSRECRECSICPPGYKLVQACTNRTDTVCEKCPRSTFSRKNNSLVCKLCRVCPYYSVEIRPCTSNRNAKCRTCTEDSYYSREFKNCKKCSSCPKGTYVDKKCSMEEDVRCVKCPRGTYSDVEDMFPFCSVCTHCRRFEDILQVCTSEQNNICGECRQGYFRLQSTLQCVRCSPCYSHIRGHRYEVIPECQRRLNGTDNICMPTDYRPTPAKPSFNHSPVPSLTILSETTVASFTIRSIEVTTALNNTFYKVKTRLSDVSIFKNKSSPHRNAVPSWSASEDKKSPFELSTSNPFVVAGGVAIFLLSFILIVIIAILVYVHRCRRSRLAMVVTKDTLPLTEAVPLNVNSSFLKTSQFVKDLKTPSNIRKKTFSEPDLGVDHVVRMTTMKKRSKSWPDSSSSGRSFRNSVVSFLRNMFYHGRSEEMDNISNSIRMDGSNMDVSPPSSSQNCLQTVEVYRNHEEESLTLEYTPLTKETSNTFTASCSS